MVDLMETDTEKQQSKKEKDFTPEVNKKIAETQQLLDKQGPSALQQVLDQLYVLEKQTRLAGDGESNTKIIVQIVKACIQCKQWTVLIDALNALAKKRNQVKQAITRMVQEAMEGLSQTPNKETKVDLINCLRKITEGKIYVEVERARLIRTLAKMKEEEGKVEEAADLLQEVQIETVGSMEPREKIDFILEQMRLILDKQDYVRAFIVSKKVTTKALNNEKHQDLKIRYYNLMIRYYNYKKDYLEICKAYHAIYDTPKVQEDVDSWIDALSNMVVFIVLSPYDNHQSDLMNRIWIDRKLEEPPLQLFREFLKPFVKGEVIHWPQFSNQYKESIFLKHRAFHFGNDFERWNELHDRVVEHNIRIISKHYERISMNRLAQILYLETKPTEEYVSKMVTLKTISAKIDRIDAIVTFKPSQQSAQVLNDWNDNIVQLLNKVEKVTHLKTVSQNKK